MRFEANFLAGDELGNDVAVTVDGRYVVEAYEHARS